MKTAYLSAFGLVLVMILQGCSGEDAPGAGAAGGEATPEIPLARQGNVAQTVQKIPHPVTPQRHLHTDRVPLA